MAATLEVESTLTDRYQTTVPETMRPAIKPDKRNKIHDSIRPGGQMVLTRVEVCDADDPVLGQVLRYPATGINRHRARRQAVDVGLIRRLCPLVDDIDVDLAHSPSERCRWTVVAPAASDRKPLRPLQATAQDRHPLRKADAELPQYNSSDLRHRMDETIHWCSLVEHKEPNIEEIH